MEYATPQRTVAISLSGRMAEDTTVTYSYWSPNDGYTRTGSSSCDLYHKTTTNTLFVLDFASTQNGWTITGTVPKPFGSPSLKTTLGPANTSIMTHFKDKTPDDESFRFYILYTNTLTGADVRFDPQEENRVPM
jgi:hypothetical protein